MTSKRRETQTGGREATNAVIPGRFALSVGKPDLVTPQGWSWTRLTDVARLETGHTPSRKHPEYWDGDIPWVGIKDATSNHGSVINDTFQHATQLGIDNSSARVLPANTVCLSRTASVGYVVIMGRSMATSQDFVNWVCSNSIDHRYLASILVAERSSYALFSRGTTHQTIYFPEVKAFHALLPPIQAQKRIADFIWSINDKIQLNHQINQTLEQMAQAIFKSWFVDFEPVKAKIAALDAGGTEDDALLAAMQAISGRSLYDADASAAGGSSSATGVDPLAQMQAEQPEQYAELRATAELFPSAMQDSELGEIPEGWRVGELAELFELHRGFDLPQSKRMAGDVPVYAAGGLHGTHNAHKMEPPGIITGRSGVIGNVYLSLSKYWPLNTTLYVRKFRKCGPYYAYHLLKSLDLKSFNSGSAVPSLNRNFVHAARICVPDSRVLSKFEAIAGPLFKASISNANQSDSLATLRDTLLPKLLSGELTLPDTEDPQAELQDVAHV